jgi:hypothetical protein
VLKYHAMKTYGGVEVKVKLSLVKGKVKLSLYRPWRPLGLREVEAPTFSRQSAHRWRQGCQPYAPAAFLPPGSFLVLIPVRG